MDNKILILGSNGQVGSEVARILKNQGYSLALATSRKPEKEEQVHLNLDNGEGLKEAFTGVSRAFVMAPSTSTNQDEILIPVIDEAKKQNIEKIVLLTAPGGNDDPESPVAKTEEALKNSGINYNIIRPNWFMQNFNSYWLEGIAKDQKIYLPVGDSKASFIDSRDIASVGAKLLIDDSFNNKDYDLTGGQALDHYQVADILSKVTGKNIKYEDISPEAMREILLKQGFTEEYSEFMLLILSYLKKGYSEDITTAVKDVTGNDPITFNQYAEDYKNNW